MSKTTLPTSSDVTTVLSALPNAITLPSGFDVASELAGAVTEWNNRTGYHPFFQTSATATTRYFDPPGPQDRGSTRGAFGTLALENGLLSITSLYVAVDVGNSDPGTLLVKDQDYWLKPSNAVADGEPYTHVDFAYARRGLPNSIAITGVWGYCTGTIPDDAWLAIRNLAVAGVLETYREGLKSGAIVWHDAEVSESYSPEQLARLGADFRQRAFRALNRYRNWS